jgi:putative ABC transport system substrate-binding protein
MISRPGNLPVQQATKFELGVNLRTARAIGVTLSKSVLVRAAEIIE